VLAGSGVTNTGSSVINGDLGTCPTPAITGFPPGIVNGTVHADDAVACDAQSDTTIAYNDAAGRASTTTYGGPTDLGGRKLIAGVYATPTSFSITGQLVLDGQGDPDATFVFQAGSTLLTATDSSVTMVNGAQACNVFWQVGSSATLGVGSTLLGTVLALTSITADTNARIQGRLLARTGAVTLDSNVVTRPACLSAPTTTAPPVATTTTAVTTPTTTGPSTTTSTPSTTSTTSGSTTSTTSTTSGSTTSTTSASTTSTTSSATTTTAVPAAPTTGPANRVGAPPQELALPTSPQVTEVRLVTVTPGVPQTPSAQTGLTNSGLPRTGSSPGWMPLVGLGAILIGVALRHLGSDRRAA
jgi:type VI secretion system secreted protein VgrG